MNRGIASAIGGVVVGIVLFWAYQVTFRPPPPPPVVDNCPPGIGSASDQCIYVPVNPVGGQPTLGPIPDTTLKAKGNIWWVLTNAPGYNFSFPNPPPPGAPAIDFVNISAPKVSAGNDISNCAWQSATLFKCHNDHNNKGMLFGYNVTVSDGTTTLPADPYIINN
jgi:hypothetical protein